MPTSYYLVTTNTIPAYFPVNFVHTIYNFIFTIISGYTIVLIMNSIKIVVFVLFLSTFFQFNPYSASIVSLFQSMSSSINNVKDFLHEKSMTMSIQIASYTKPYFDVSINQNLSFYQCGYYYHNI